MNRELSLGEKGILERNPKEIDFIVKSCVFFALVKVRQISKCLVKVWNVLSLLFIPSKFAASTMVTPPSYSCSH